MLAQGSPVFHSSCEGELGIALELLQGKRDLMKQNQYILPGAPVEKQDETF